MGALNFFNEFVFEHINMKSTPKHAELINNVNAFFKGHSNMWAKFLETALSFVLFEENRNIWIFQKWLYSTLVIIINLQGMEIVQKVVIDMLNNHEKNPDRKQKIMEQFTVLMQHTSFKSLDQKSKDAFSRKFSNLKTFVV